MLQQRNDYGLPPLVFGIKGVLRPLDVLLVGRGQVFGQVSIGSPEASDLSAQRFLGGPQHTRLIKYAEIFSDKLGKDLDAAATLRRAAASLRQLAIG